MVNTQELVNHFSKLLRLQAIEYLIKRDCMMYNHPIPSDEEIDFRKSMIFKMPCCTKMLKRLFSDAHDMHEEKGMMPHAVSVGDLEWCLKNRVIGYSCTQRVKHSWLVAKEDDDLRRLPAFIELTRIYKPMIESGKNILPPVEKKAVENEALAIVNELAISMKEA
ncbi:hypothetical protein [Fibrobacter sp.]|uniref:hypothetical protein n=1 Tax=Fibrobacter sp. TaxID=35828 RepID=UPI00388FEA61